MSAVKLPRGFNLKYAKKAIAGHADSVIFAFNWDDTDQGECYWNSVCETGLTKRAKRLVNEFIALAEAKEAKPRPQTMHDKVSTLIQIGYREKEMANKTTAKVMAVVRAHYRKKAKS